VDCQIGQFRNPWIARFAPALSLSLSLSSERKKERRETGRGGKKRHVEEKAQPVEKTGQSVENKNASAPRGP
jgi:hypothetical protein